MQLVYGGFVSNGRIFIDVVYIVYFSELKVFEDIEEIKFFYSMIVGDVDFVLLVEKVKQSVGIFEKKVGVFSEVVIVFGVRYGFVVRYDLENKVEIEMVDQVEDQMVRWFVNYLY